MTVVLFLCLGAIAGVLQALLLRKSARDGGHPVGFLLRLAAVAAALVWAAISGHLLIAVAGWGLAFVITSAAVLLRWR